MIDKTYFKNRRKNKDEKSLYIITFDGNEYRVLAKDRNEAVSKCAFILDVPIRSLYGKITVCKEKYKKRKYVIINRNKEEVFEGTIEEVADKLNLSIYSIYNIVQCVSKSNNYWNKKNDVIVCHVEDKEKIMKRYKFNEEKQ